MDTLKTDQERLETAPSNIITEIAPTPFLWFDDNTEEALHIFVSEFLN
jgi:hypothetical protein